MRRTIVIRTSAGASIAFVLLWWCLERNAGSELNSRLADLRNQERELSHRHSMRPDWHEQRAVPEERNPDSVLPSTDRESSEPAEPPAATFVIGEWASAEDWKNEGYSTPRATIATLLWAAAGGDLGVMQDALALDEDTRAKARQWFDSLPSAFRDTYATPENLVVTMTANRIAPIAAQLIWDHQADEEHAIIGLLLATEQSQFSPMPASPPERADELLAPSIPRTSSNRLAALTLRRSPTGWRIVVPAAAIDTMAKSLREAEPVR